VIATREGDAEAVTGVGAGGPNGAASVAYILLRAARGDELTQATDLRTTGLAPFSTVNVIACQTGTCAALSDPGSSGLGMAAAGPGQAEPQRLLAAPESSSDEQMTEEPAQTVAPDQNPPAAQQLTRQ
jgi:hypothetical protein